MEGVCRTVGFVWTPTQHWQKGFDLRLTLAGYRE